MNIKRSITDIYESFRKDFNKNNFPEVFELIHKHNAAKGKPSDYHLGGWSILYTPIRWNPKFMLIGNNPSWFDKDSPATSAAIIQKLMEGPPNDNSYMEHNHTFGMRLRGIFGKLGRLDLLSNCVGMNRCWLQTGPENTSWQNAFMANSTALGTSFENYCEGKTLEIIRLLEPETVLLIGAKAGRLAPDHFEGSTEIRQVAYPLGRGITQLTSQLAEILSGRNI